MQSREDLATCQPNTEEEPTELFCACCVKSVTSIVDVLCFAVYQAASLQ